MFSLTKFVIKDNFRSNLIIKGLFKNFKKRKDETRISVKLRDFLGIFPKTKDR